MKMNKASWVIVDAGIEHELKDLDDKDKKEMREGLGAKDDGVDDLIRKGYELLDLITYFTTGEDETRAWTIHKGDTAPVAAGVIHTDFQKGFIKAEVLACAELARLGSVHAARETGKYRLEGRDYVVQDGDVMLFRFSP